MQTTKPFWQSKTLWVNAITLVLAILRITDPAQFHFDPQILVWVAGVLNIFLRFLTDKALSVDGTPKSS